MRAPFIGHRIQHTLLQQQLLASEARGAYLVYGQTGLGKNYLVSTLIADTLCPEAEEACGQCSDCHWFAQNSHPDIYRLAVSEPCTVDRARDISSFARTKAVRASGRKYIIIEKADSMTTEAANALLKLLEEPPEGVVFFLLAERSQAVLATVRSRCQLVKLLPLSDVDMRLIVKQQGVPEDQIDLILGLSLGRPGRALALARGQIQEYQAVVPEILRWLQGDVTSSFRSLKEWLDTVVKEQTSADAKQAAMTTRLNHVELLLRDLVFYQVQTSYVVNKSLVSEIQKLSQRYSLSGLMLILKKISYLRAQLANKSANQQLHWENFILNIKQISQTS